MRHRLFRSIFFLLLVAAAMLVPSMAFAQPAQPPVLTKAFSPATIPPGGTTTLTFTVSNPSGGSALGDISFTDTLPSGLVVASTPNVGGTCANAAAATLVTPGGNSIAVANLQVAAGPSSCIVQVNVTNAPGMFNASCDAFPAAFTNAAANVSGSTFANLIQPSCVVVPPPVLTKAFSPTTIPPGGTTTLTFTVSNPAGNPALSNIGFTDTLPSGLVVGPGGVGGTCSNAVAATSAAAGGSSIAVTNLEVAAGTATCNVTVNVTNAPGMFNASCDAFPADFTNAATNVSVSNVVSGIQSSCLVVPPPVLTKAFSPTTILPGGTTTLTFTVSNPAGNSALSNVGFTDTLPSGLVVAAGSVGGTCANAAAATSATTGAGSITVANLDVPAGPATCTVAVEVTNLPDHFNATCSSFPAAFTNAASNVSASNVVSAIEPGCVVVTPPALSSSVPVLSGPALAILGALLAGAALWALKR